MNSQTRQLATHFSLSILSFLFLLTGCTTNTGILRSIDAASRLKTYPGPLLPRDKVAVLNCTGGLLLIGAVQLLSVDGSSVFFNTYSPYDTSNVIPDSVELLPGKHTLEFAPFPPFSGDRLLTEYSFSEGAAYKARMNVSDLKTTSPYGARTTTSAGHWSLEISEVKPAPFGY